MFDWCNVAFRRGVKYGLFVMEIPTDFGATLFHLHSLLLT